MTTIQEALQQYNAHFDNQKYQMIANHLAQDLRAERESLKVSDAMNLISDVAFQLVQHPHYTEAYLQLAIFCGQNNVSIVTIDLMSDYLRLFQSVPDTIIDDFEAMKGDSKEAGATTKMIEQRFASFGKSKKIFYISTPELKPTSNIEPVYLQGDQRKYFIPCPCCGEFINLEWKAFFRSASFGKSIAIKIFMGFLALYFMGMFLLIGFFMDKILKEVYPDLDPLVAFNGLLFS